MLLSFSTPRLFTLSVFHCFAGGSRAAE
eukprot:SAG31_NODE_36030_length_317_cov_0.715596_2_plen_27_part_01